MFHAIDYLDAKSYRKKFLEDSADFVMVDRIAHAFKHVKTRDPKIPSLSAGEVIQRPPMACGVAAVGLSRAGDAVGGVTIDRDRAQDVLSAVKRAAEFLRGQIGRSFKGERR